MEEQFKNLVDNAKSILILLPTKPFFDQVAAGLALFLALREQKDVQIVSPSPITVDFNRIVGINKVTQEMGNKNLVIRFLDYKPDDIERIKYDLDNGQMFLTIIPKPAAKAPAKDQVQMSYSGVAADTVFLIGGMNDSHFPQLANKDLASAKLVHIGIKDVMLTGDKHPVSLARPSSSVSELVYYLLKNNGYDIDQDAASDLLMGIEDETNNFSDRDANADTFLAAADLMKRGAKRFSGTAPITPNNFPPGAIPNMSPSGMPQMPPMQMPQQPQMQPAQPMQPYPMPQMPNNFPGAPQPMPQPQSRPPQPKPKSGKPVDPPVQQMPEPGDENPEEMENAPEEWLNKPKVYKGTSVS